MNLILLAPGEINDDHTVILADRRSLHLVRVLGAKTGDRLKAGIINGPVGHVEVISIHKDGNSVRVVLKWTSQGLVADAPLCDLILALVRPIMLKKIMAQAASLGVGRIFLINANRVEKSFFNASLLKDERYRTYLIEGLEQAKDTHLPEVSIHERFRPFVEDFIPTIAQNYSRMLLAHPEAGEGLKQAVGIATGGRTLLAVGPEGGWVDFEIEKFLEQAFVPISLGERILRTDTAVVALLAQLMVLGVK